MRKKHTSRMMQPTSFSDFNPLDVLATAASLQRRTEDTGEDGENDGGKSTSGSDKCEEEEGESKEGGEDEREPEGGTPTGESEVTIDVVTEDASAVSIQAADQSTDNDAGQQCVSDTNDSKGEVQRPAGQCDHPEPTAMKKPMCVLQILNRNGGKGPGDARPVMTLRDATKLIVPTRQGTKSLTVLKINKHQMTDHSYAFVCQLQNLKHEEDEGYSSRSSLDDEGEDCRMAAAKAGQMHAPSPLSSPLSSPTLVAKRTEQDQSEVQQSGRPVSFQLPRGGLVLKPAPTPVGALAGEQARKATKIVIVGKDSKLQKIMAGKDNSTSLLMGTGNADGSLKAGNNEMLRTLLRQKPKSVFGPAGVSQVVVAGSLSDHVVNVLKSGRISLAPPTSSNNSSVTAETRLIEERSMLLPAEPGDSAKSDVQSQRQTVSSTADSLPMVGSCGDLEAECGTSVDREPLAGDVLTEASQTIEQASNCSTDIDLGIRNSSHCDSSGDSLAGNKKEDGVEDAAVLSGDEGSVDSRVETDGEVQGFCAAPDKETPQESEEVTTEDEGSRDESDVFIVVETTPVCSPSMDSQTALMSPVNERDGSMMSPTVGSMELCDLFKLPTMMKHIIADQSVNVASYDMTVGCVVNNPPPSAQLSVTSIDPDEEAIPATNELPDQLGESILMSPKSDTKSSSESDESEGLALVTKDPQEEDAEDTASENEAKDLLVASSKGDPSSDNSQLPSEDSCPLPGTDVSLPKIGLPVADRPATPEFDEDESRPATPDLLGLTVLDPSKNQYIIEDDESPVTKFGTPRSSGGEESPSSNCSSPIALPVASVPPATNTGTTETTACSPIEAPLREKVKLLVTPECNQKSVFTAVRRPVVTSLNALPGNLQVVPVVPPNKTKGNIMHVVPVSCARIVPKSGQYVTGVPVLGGKTVVQVSEANKGRVSTLLVPLSVATNSSSGTPVSLVQGPKTKLINVRTDSGSRLSSTDSESARSPSTPRKDVSSPLVFHGRLTPLSSTTSENSESMSSPESSLQGGFSGLIMGRRTPDNAESTRSSLQSLESSPKDKINIRISASSVLESDDSRSSETSFTSKKESIGIGTMGSLSWKSVETAKCLTPIGSVQRSGPEFVRIQGGEVKRGIQVALEKNASNKKAEDQALPRKVGRPLKSAGTSANKTLHAYSRKRRKLASESGAAAGAPPLVTQALYIPHVSQLHPLIDHDYCMFTDFNAQIQSSIIATTESKAKIEKKYAKKSKAVRTKAVRGVAQEEHIKTSVKLAAEKAVTKGRRGRLKKRLLAKEKTVSEEDRSCEQTDDQQDKTEASEPRPVKKQVAAEPRPSRTSERRARLQALKDNKNYVKITGSYQDEFVYFATKNKRCRPRKSADSDQADPQLTKQPQVGGMTVFDWYHDLAKADKTSRFGTPTGSRFGTPTASGSSSPVPFSKGIADTSSPPVSTLATSSSDMSTSSKPRDGHRSTPSFPPSATPLHESEVADLVCDLSDINTLGGTIDNTAEKQLFSSLMLGGPELKTETVTTTTEEGSGGGVDMNFMAEQVRNMLNCMGEDELQMLGKELGSGTTGMADTSFDSFLSGFTPEAPAGISQPAASTNLCDLDEINDSDLLQSDITSMNVILGDLKESSGQTIKSQGSSGLKTSASAPALLLDVGEKLPGSDVVGLAGFSKTLELGTVKLDKSELFPDMAPPPVDITDTMAPELTVVSMYWNDLPGLMIRGEQYVRLVDIHKQVLPAKDTGILKKRCQMMGLPITNCTELQRDFLVRYANAAKSKSTVVVAKEAAQTLIGFYVEPKSRAPKQSSEDRSHGAAQEAVQEDKGTVASKDKSDGEAVEKDVQDKTPTPPATPVTPKLTTQKTTPETIPKSRTAGKGTGRKRRLTEANPESSPDTPVNNGDLKRSARLRFKKVCYSDMLLGNHYDSPEKKEKDSEDSPSAVTPLEVKMHQKAKEAEAGEDLKQSDESEVSDDHENKDIRRSLYPEDLEIRKIKLKMRKKSLNQVEKKRLRRLRDKVRKREIKRKLRERRKHAKLRNKQKTIGASHIGVLAKTKRKLQETHVYTKKYNQEHCYAAAPEVSQEEELRPQTPVGAAEASHEEELRPQTPAGTSEEKPTVADTPEEVAEPPTPDPELAEVPQEEKVVEKTPEVVKSEPEAAPEAGERPPLRVLHRDSVHRVNQRGRWQDGALHLDRYQAVDSAFIQCITCAEYFNLKHFMKHMHHQNNRDELAHVTLTQKLELSSPLPSEDETVMWNNFQKRRQELTTSGSKAKCERRQKAAARITHKSNGRPREQLAVNTTLNNTVRESARNTVKNSPVKSSPVKSPPVKSPPVKGVSPSVAKAGKQTTPSSTRHSTRVRKRKQLHPIEKYVFSKLSPSSEQPTKRARLESGSAEVEAGRRSFEANGSHQGTPVRGVRLRLSSSTSKQNLTKYDLRGGGGSTDSETKRPTKVLGKRHRNSDTSSTAMADKVADKTV